MHCLIVLLLAITGSLAAIRCFQGQETFPAGQGTPYVAGGLLFCAFRETIRETTLRLFSELPYGRVLLQ